MDGARAEADGASAPKGRVAGLVALVTGGAQGIGLATGQALARDGATVVLADIAADPGAEAARALAKGGATAAFLDLDVTDEAAWRDRVDTVVDRFGRLDILINNAGIGTMSDIERCTVAEFRRNYAVNAEGVFLGCREAVRVMKETGGGSIVNVSSLAGLVGAPHLPAYCASKGAVRLLTKSVALHCARKGYNIRCNSVHPSYADTAMVDDMVSRHRDPDRYRAGLQAAAPLGRLATAAEVAAVILFLASPEASFVTGAEYVVDGGITAT